MDGNWKWLGGRSAKYVARAVCPGVRLKCTESLEELHEFTEKVYVLSLQFHLMRGCNVRGKKFMSETGGNIGVGSHFKWMKKVVVTRMMQERIRFSIRSLYFCHLSICETRTQFNQAHHFSSAATLSRTPLFAKPHTESDGDRSSEGERRGALFRKNCFKVR